MRADDARGEPERHLARLELTAERKHLAAALAFIRVEANRLSSGRGRDLPARAEATLARAHAWAPVPVTQSARLGRETPQEPMPQRNWNV